MVTVQKFVVMSNISQVIGAYISENYAWREISNTDSLI